MRAIALGTQQWAWTSMVLTRLPLTTTSRRRGWAWPWPCAGGPGSAAALCISQPVKAMARGRRARNQISRQRHCRLPRSVRLSVRHSLQRLDPGVASATMAAPVPGGPSMADHDHDPHHEQGSELSETQLPRARAGNDPDRERLRRPGGARCHRRGLRDQGRPAQRRAPSSPGPGPMPPSGRRC